MEKQSIRALFLKGSYLRLLPWTYPIYDYVLLPHGGAFRVVADAVFWYNNIITVRTKENLRALAVQTTGRYFKFRRM